MMNISVLAYQLNENAKKCGMFVGLTGGCLYKPGPRKDVDFVLYRHRQGLPDPEKAIPHFIQELVSYFGGRFAVVGSYGFVTKVTIDDMQIDFLFPEYPLQDDEEGYTQ